MDAKNKERLTEWLKFRGYELINHKSPRYGEFTNFFRESKANVNESITTVPILINSKTGECIIGDGIVVLPIK